jgi:hypothetical protein
MVPGQHGAKLTHFLPVPALRGQLAGLHISGVGVVEDGAAGAII